MAECRYCGTSFDTDDELLAHLRKQHELDELSRIDRRRVAGGGDEETGGLPTGAIAGVGISAVVLLGLLAAIVLIGSNGADADPVLYTDEVETAPTNYQSLHEHGLMEVTIDGERFDFASDQSLIENDPYWFHFHGGTNVWHTHGEDVTLEYALATLGITIEEGGTILEYDGTVYDDRDEETSVAILVDGEPVDPTEYVLEGVAGISPDAASDGDYVEVIVETDE